MRLDKLLLGLLVFSVFILAGTNIVLDLNTKYDDVDISTANFDPELYNYSNGLYDTAEGMDSQTLGGSVEEDSTEESMFKGSYSAIRQFTNAYTWMGNIINLVAKEIPGLNIFIGFALTAAWLLVIFGIIFLVFRLRG